MRQHDTMRVEVRQRIGIRPAGAVSAAASERPGSRNLSVIEAYQDSCFESPTRFFTVAPEHPKLGRWAIPSTLKYSQAPQTALVESRSRQPQTVCSSPVAARGCHAKRGGGSPSSPTRSASSPGGGGGGGVSKCNVKGPRHKMMESIKAAGGGGGGGGGVQNKNKRPLSAAGALRWGPESPPPSPPRGGREEPRINTPVSGRVSESHRLLRPVLPMHVELATHAHTFLSLV